MLTGNHIFIYFSADFEPKRFTLDTSVCYEKKTANQIVSNAMGCLSRYGAEALEITFVVDAANSMKAACRQMGQPFHLCTGHGVHNLVSVDGVKATPALQSICGKARMICKKVRYRSADIEREAQLQQHNEWMDAIIEVDAYLEMDEDDPLRADDGEHFDFAAEDVYLEPLETPTTVKLPVANRWHTTVIMLESMEKNKVSWPFK